MRQQRWKSEGPMMQMQWERERCGESDNSQKVRHTIVALREIADKLENQLTQEIKDSTLVSEWAKTDEL